jgi:hypothetical protein
MAVNTNNRKSALYRGVRNLDLRRVDLGGERGCDLRHLGVSHQGSKGRHQQCLVLGGQSRQMVRCREALLRSLLRDLTKQDLLGKRANDVVHFDKTGRHCCGRMELSFKKDLFKNHFLDRCQFPLNMFKYGPPISVKRSVMCTSPFFWMTKQFFAYCVCFDDLCIIQYNNL